MRCCLHCPPPGRSRVQTRSSRVECEDRTPAVNFSIRHPSLPPKEVQREDGTVSALPMLSPLGPGGHFHSGNRTFFLVEGCSSIRARMLSGTAAEASHAGAGPWGWLTQPQVPSRERRGRSAVCHSAPSHPPGGEHTQRTSVNGAHGESSLTFILGSEKKNC